MDGIGNLDLCTSNVSTSLCGVGVLAAKLPATVISVRGSGVSSHIVLEHNESMTFTACLALSKSICSKWHDLTLVNLGNEYRLSSAGNLGGLLTDYAFKPGVELIQV